MVRVDVSGFFFNDINEVDKSLAGVIKEQMRLSNDSPIDETDSIFGEIAAYIEGHSEGWNGFSLSF